MDDSEDCASRRRYTFGDVWHQFRRYVFPRREVPLDILVRCSFMTGKQIRRYRVWKWYFCPRLFWVTLKIWIHDVMKKVK